MKFPNFNVVGGPFVARKEARAFLLANNKNDNELQIKRKHYFYWVKDKNPDVAVSREIRATFGVCDTIPVDNS